MKIKKKVVICIACVVAILAIFLWPHSLLGGTKDNVKSISIVTVKDNFEHTEDTYRFNAGDEKFDDIMSALNQYTYHFSLNTIIKGVKNETSLESNKAGYWLNIYLYSEPDCFGECYQIISGGTGEIIVDDGVYRIGYWGNEKNLDFMTDICTVVE